MPGRIPEVTRPIGKGILHGPQTFLRDLLKLEINHSKQLKISSHLDLGSMSHFEKRVQSRPWLNLLAQHQDTKLSVESEYWINYRVQVDWQVESEWNKQLRVVEYVSLS
jgi:hypothetical protein